MNTGRFWHPRHDSAVKKNWTATFFDIRDIIRRSKNIALWRLMLNYVEYCQKMSNNVEYLKNCKHYRIFPILVELCRIFSNKVENCQIMSNNVAYFQILSNDVEYCRKLLGCTLRGDLKHNHSAIHTMLEGIV